MARYFLFCHSIEMALKAFLIVARGIDDDDKLKSNSAIISLRNC